MKRMILFLSVAVLLAMVPALARSKKEPPTPGPTPTSYPTDAPTNSQLRKIKIEAYVLSSVEDKTQDGEPIRDIIILVNSLINEGQNAVPMSYKSFLLRDASAHYYAANGSSSDDFNKESPVSPLDGDLPYFKLYFKVPGDLRPNKMYLRVGDDVVSYKLQR